MKGKRNKKKKKKEKEEEEEEEEEDLSLADIFIGNEKVQGLAAVKRDVFKR